MGRKARQLVFGFQAMAFLKTENLSYAVKKEDYAQYFRCETVCWWSVSGAARV